jgi:large subunit ribosomal protein L21
MIYAVAKINGKQYKLVEGQEFNVDRLPLKEGDTLDIKDILFVGQDDVKLFGEEAKKASIKAKVVAEFLGPKVLVLKYKKRKRYRKLTGHRQSLTKLRIEVIDFAGKKVEKKVEKPKKAAPKTEAKKAEPKKVKPSKKAEK